MKLTTNPGCADIAQFNQSERPKQDPEVAERFAGKCYRITTQFLKESKAAPGLHGFASKRKDRVV